MDPASPFPAVAALLLAVGTAGLLARRFGTPPPLGRYAAIDGLRGYLAFFVFLHHSCIWYFYLRTGRWELPPSHLYAQMGKGSCALFFMITGFLFFSKLLDGRTKKIDWTRLYLSRFLRLTPLYLFAMLLLFIIVAVLSKGSLREPLPHLLGNAARWLGFTIPGSPDLNGVPNTSVIVAKVTWTLLYEWYFYCSLPLLALLLRVGRPLPLLIISIACFFSLALAHHRPIELFAFLGGIAAALLVRLDQFCAFARSPAASCLLLACLGAVSAFFQETFTLIPLLLFSAAFILIAGGNTLFGALTAPASRTLGEMAYSIYLLHGLTLFVLFHFIIGAPPAKMFSPMGHWLVIMGVTPFLILACFLTFQFIEHPAMRNTTRLNHWLRARWSALRTTLKKS